MRANWDIELELPSVGFAFQLDATVPSHAISKSLEEKDHRNEKGQLCDNVDWVGRDAASCIVPS
jgi:hypothetical protein